MSLDLLKTTNTKISRLFLLTIAKYQLIPKFKETHLLPQHRCKMGFPRGVQTAHFNSKYSMWMSICKPTPARLTAIFWLQLSLQSLISAKFLCGHKMSFLMATLKITQQTLLFLCPLTDSQASLSPVHTTQS